MTTNAPSPRKGRAATGRAILSAAKAVLAEDGFQGFGINAVARRAGCDKQLIYRYFGGLEGLVDAIGADLAAGLEDSLTLTDRPATYAEFAERMALTFLDTFRADALLQKIAAWEVAAASPLVRRLTAARSQRLSRWIVAQRGDLAPPAGIDAAAANAVIIAAMQHLVLASAAAGEFSGMPLRAPADWDRVRETVCALVRSLFGASTPSP